MSCGLDGCLPGMRGEGVPDNQTKAIGSMGVAEAQGRYEHIRQALGAFGDDGGNGNGAAETGGKRQCPHCQYEWKPRVASPKYCPNPKCKHLLDEAGQEDPEAAQEAATLHGETAGQDAAAAPADWRDMFELPALGADQATNDTAAAQWLNTHSAEAGDTAGWQPIGAVTKPEAQQYMAIVCAEPQSVEAMKGRMNYIMRGQMRTGEFDTLEDVPTPGASAGYGRVFLFKGAWKDSQRTDLQQALLGVDVHTGKPLVDKTGQSLSLHSQLQNGTPIRTSDRAGAGTKGTRAWEPLRGAFAVAVAGVNESEALVTREILTELGPVLEDYGVPAQQAYAAAISELHRFIPRCSKCGCFMSTQNPVCRSRRCSLIGIPQGESVTWPPPGYTFKNSKVRVTPPGDKALSAAHNPALLTDSQDAAINYLEAHGSHTTRGNGWERHKTTEALKQAARGIARTGAQSELARVARSYQRGHTGPRAFAEALAAATCKTCPGCRKPMGQNHRCAANDPVGMVQARKAFAALSDRQKEKQIAANANLEMVTGALDRAAFQGWKEGGAWSHLKGDAVTRADLKAQLATALDKAGLNLTDAETLMRQVEQEAGLEWKATVPTAQAGRERKAPEPYLARADVQNSRRAITRAVKSALREAAIAAPVNEAAPALSEVGVPLSQMHALTGAAQALREKPEVGARETALQRVWELASQGAYPTNEELAEIEAGHAAGGLAALESRIAEAQPAPGENPVTFYETQLTDRYQAQAAQFEKEAQARVDALYAEGYRPKGMIAGMLAMTRPDGKGGEDYEYLKYRREIAHAEARQAALTAAPTPEAPHAPMPEAAPEEAAPAPAALIERGVAEGDPHVIERAPYMGAGRVGSIVTPAELAVAQNETASRVMRSAIWEAVNTEKSAADLRYANGRTAKQTIDAALARGYTEVKAEGPYLHLINPQTNEAVSFRRNVEKKYLRAALAAQEAKDTARTSAMADVAGVQTNVSEAVRGHLLAAQVRGEAKQAAALAGGHEANHNPNMDLPEVLAESLAGNPNLLAEGRNWETVGSTSQFQPRLSEADHAELTTLAQAVRHTRGQDLNQQLMRHAAQDYLAAQREGNAPRMNLAGARLASRILVTAGAQHCPECGSYLTRDGKCNKPHLQNEADTDAHAEAAGLAKEGYNRYAQTGATYYTQREDGRWNFVTENPDGSTVSVTLEGARTLAEAVKTDAVTEAHFEPAPPQAAAPEAAALPPSDLPEPPPAETAPVAPSTPPAPAAETAPPVTAAPTSEEPAAEFAGLHADLQAEESEARTLPTGDPTAANFVAAVKGYAQALQAGNATEAAQHVAHMQRLAEALPPGEIAAVMNQAEVIAGTGENAIRANYGELLMARQNMAEAAGRMAYAEEGSPEYAKAVADWTKAMQASNQAFAALPPLTLNDRQRQRLERTMRAQARSNGKPKDWYQKTPEERARERIARMFFMQTLSAVWPGAGRTFANVQMGYDLALFVGDKLGIGKNQETVEGLLKAHQEGNTARVQELGPQVEQAALEYMAEVKAQGQQANCPACGHTWDKRVATPVECPQCGGDLTAQAAEALQEMQAELRQERATMAALDAEAKALAQGDTAPGEVAPVAAAPPTPPEAPPPTAPPETPPPPTNEAAVPPVAAPEANNGQGAGNGDNNGNSGAGGESGGDADLSKIMAMLAALQDEVTAARAEQAELEAEKSRLQAEPA